MSARAPGGLRLSNLEKKRKKVGHGTKKEEILKNKNTFAEGGVNNSDTVLCHLVLMA